ncbi:MAG: cytochrome P450 [Acidimicrobiales bacterium]
MTQSSDMVADIDLSSLEFWELPLEVRDEALSRLRRYAPVRHFDEPLWSYDEEGRGFYAITRHADLIEVSRNPEVFSSAQGAVSIPDMPEEFIEFFGSMINTDDPRHGSLRRIVSAAFTPKRLHALEAAITRRAHELVARFAEAGSGDFVSQVAAALPLGIICEMMGVPSAEDATVLAHSNVILGAFDERFVSADQDPFEAILTSAIALRELMELIADDRRTHPRDDVTSALVHGEAGGEHLSTSELASFFILLVVAGNETTRNAISWGMWALHRFPEERRRWFASFDAMTSTAVEEIVRWSSPVMFMRRTATRNTQIRGVPIEEGAKVLLLYGSANRDEEVFTDPNVVNLAREGNRHVGFGGFGPHYCLGVHLARREIGAVFREISSRMPEYWVDGEPRRLRSNFINGLTELRIRRD